ncbi:ImmA/IrrE family metallo-endopeptidase [Roseisolibacter agri]|uniref:ImmA/IrrE family metallo-endopeptidase n=1 Tax=Roseisolibacter agri TaxID=2014610 RepID=UPI0024E0C402|nr:ImmA/IrrE family metallo-endopeptidase [Roseisolibacter agri]
MAGDDDPVAAVTDRARDLVLRALDQGWAGPPFDPIALADLLKIEVTANGAVRDARTVPVAGETVRIEFNPNRPRGRVRYSLAHEIAHTLFPDCAAEVRHRARHHELTGDAWQLEALCNIAAAEFLMPLGSLGPLTAERLTVPTVLDLQRRFDVSTEALVIRLAETSPAPVAAFCVSPRNAATGATGATPGAHPVDYQVDYVIPSRAWATRRMTGRTTGHGTGRRRRAHLPGDSVVRQCSAIGYSARGVEAWWDDESPVHVEAVGIPPYPGGAAPRVIGLLHPATPEAPDAPAAPEIAYVYGSATEPRGPGRRLVVQVVNDKTANWGGGGFASAVRSAWPVVQADFRDWAEHHRAAFRLGGVRVSRVDDGLSVASVVAQHGYGPSPSRRIRYEALRTGLRAVARAAHERQATVHMPRIGMGHAGGEWAVIADIIRDTLLAADVPVTVYDLPGAPPPVDVQPSLPFG